MKKIPLLFLLSFAVMAAMASAKEKKVVIEVLYFKANLACCKARACNALEVKVKEIVEKNWTDGSVTFRQVKLSDLTNAELIKKYSAQSQTLVLVKSGKKKETSLDISMMLQAYAKTNDAQKFENEFTARVNEFIRQK
jgi:type 1 fimbria pilin